MKKLLSRITKNVLFVIFIIVSFNKMLAFEYDNSHLFELSFQELMETSVRTASLLSLSNFKKPASVTTITANEIKITPHKNIYDLIEAYVPGAIFFNHYDVSTIGLRGLISDRNNKILILINNKVSNNKARSGAYAELSNWDLGDIERIEVIRGSGSVTYGPGAISAVINIITKDYNSSESNGIKLNYLHPYNSMGISGQYTKEIMENINFFGYFSIQKTSGYQPSNAYSIMYNNWKYENTINDQFQNYIGDFLDIPQKKLHLNFQLFDDYNLWIRYNNTGTNSNGASNKTYYQYGLDSNFQPLIGDHRNTQLISNEQFIVCLENEYEINEKLNLSSSISYDIENNARSMGYFVLWTKNDEPSEIIRKEIIDQSNIRNMYNFYSEREILGNFVLRAEKIDKIRFAIGTSLSYNTWGAPFGEDDNMIRMGDRSNIISGTDSPIYGDGRYFSVDSNSAIFVGNGWSTFMYSFFGEFEYTMTPEFTVLLSARLDKDDYSDYLISPRIAFTYQFDDNNNLKLIAQQSNRMNTAEELFFQNRAGKVSSPEKLNATELIFSTTEINNTLFDISTYFNNIDILSWYDPDRTTRTTGSLSVLGFEVDGKYKIENLSIGLNHSITFLINWKLADSVNRSGVSYSDYYIEYSGNKSFGYGNNLNNWSNAATKLFANYSLLEDKLLLHLDARFYWGFDGAKDGNQIIENIIQGTEQEKNVQYILDFMKEENFYNYDLRVNASINYTIIEKATLGLLVMNIPIAGNNYRYKYEAGEKVDSYFFRMNVLEEPFTFGINFTYAF